MPIAHQRKLLIAIALLWTTSYGFPTGPPDNDEDVCRTRLPRHGVPPQTSPSPYIITTDRTTYQPGSVIRVTIESAFRRNFRGFYIQARLANDTGLVLDDKLQMLSDRALGEFMSPAPQGTKLHSCTQGLSNAVSHSQNTDKSSVTVFWRAPSRPEPWIDQRRYPEPWIGPIQFVATVVESPREVFWTNTFSDIICEGDDFRPPTFTNCPASDITEFFRPGQSLSELTVIPWTRPTVAADVCDATRGEGTSLTSSYNPNQGFPIGTTPFEYVVSDSSGNVNTCSFNVIIQTDISGCASSPCLNGGTCFDGINGYTCQCLAGWTGFNCDSPDISGCASNPCLNGGTCFDGINGYTCQCLAAWTGFNCDSPDISGCASNPCLNGGTCFDGINGYTCQCLAAWTGFNCDIPDISECASSPCLNGGQCTDTFNGYRCTCRAGWAGVRCQININECASSPCLNGGTCADDINGFRCLCSAGFTGVSCETNINECGSSPCRNGGQCTDGISQYTCSCVAGWTGINCEITLFNSCVPNPCPNSQTCTPNGDSFTCSIDDGVLFPCASMPCLNGGQCANAINGFECNCLAGWIGVRCEININECASRPCVNGGQCLDEINGYTCICIGGWTGVICEFQTDSNGCQSAPCRNGACVDGINGYTCQCFAGWTGVNCETIIRSCDSQPCVNENERCYDSIGGDYACVCIEGYSGVNCQNVFRSCDSQPCVNGICNDVDGGRYTCTCIDGYTGVNCQNGGSDYMFAFISCIGDITEFVERGVSGTSVRWIEPAVIGDPGGISLASQSHVPGYFFPVGSTSVSYTFTDGTSTAVCGFNVIVTEAPSETCAPNPCRNSGTCVESFGGIRCFCPPRFTGDRCQIAPPPEDACASFPCSNGGTCMNSGDNTGRFMCICTFGFFGLRCDQSSVTQVDCGNNPCSNGGTCVDLPAPEGYVCICPPGLFGATCEIGAGPCASSPCLNGGSCQDIFGQGFGGSMFACLCNIGFSGNRCEFDNIPPDVTACPAGIARTIDTGVGGTTMTWTEPSATDNSGFAFIQSQTHVSGQSFFQYGSTEVTYTFSDNSQNLATCLFTVTIEERVPAPDPCLASPCLNGGSCKVLLDNGFVCYCTDGFEGDRCETREMTLDLNPTQMEEFEDNYMDVINDLPNGVTLEGVLSDPVYYGRNMVPKLTEAQINMIMEEYGDIFIEEQVVIDEIQGGQGRRRRQSMSQRICPVRYETRTNLVSISGNDRSTPNENAQLVQVNNMIQWAFNAECRETACLGVQTFDGAPCACEEEMHTVSALVYNIQSAADNGFGSVSMSLKQIEVYTCDGKI